MKKVGFVIALSLFAISTASFSAVTPIAFFQMGEDDPGAIIGDAVSITIDSVGSNDLVTSGPTNVYGTGIAPGSTISVFTDNHVVESNSSYKLSDNFGVEAFFKIGTVAGQGDDLLINGTSSFNGWGITNNLAGNSSGVTTYQGFYGGVTFLNTGIASNLDDLIYMALVRDAGQTSIYFQDIGAGGTLQTFNFGGAGPSAPSGIFSVRPTQGFSDNVRVFTFQAGSFSTDDLLVSQVVPIPAAAWLFGSGLLGIFMVGKSNRLKNT